MKKLISCLLAVLLVCSLMSMSVFAKTERPVGGNEDKITDGWDAPANNNGFTNNEGTGNQDITVNFNGNNSTDVDGNGNGNSTGTIINKYSIDITYANLVIDLTDIPNAAKNENNEVIGNAEIVYVWDVNQHVYVKQYTDAEGNPITTPADVAAHKDPVTIKNAFMITNHSDLAIGYTPKINKGENAKEMEITFSDAEGTANTTKNYMINKAIAGSVTADGDVTPGSATNGKYHDILATPTTDWVVTINALSNAFVTDGAVIASIAITFTPYVVEGTTNYTNTTT